jgi:hypothetical protein
VTNTEQGLTNPASSRERRFAALSRILTRTLPWVVAVGFLLYFLPFLVLRDHSYITIPDNLDDSGFVAKRLLITSGQAFNYSSDATLPSLMNGLPRSAMGSALNLTFLPFFFLPPYGAYIFDHIVAHLLAFFGAFLLFRRHVSPAPTNPSLSLLIALGFATVPFYTQLGASVAGQPLLLFAFLNILRGGARWTDWLIIALFPFYSSFVVVGPFIIVGLVVLWGIESYAQRTFHLHFLCAVILLSSLYAVAEYQLIRDALFPGTFVTHRVEWARWPILGIPSDLYWSLYLLLKTQYQTGSFSTILIIITALTTQLIMARRRIDCRASWILCAAIAAICLFAGFYSWVNRILIPVLPPMRYVNGSRFYFLLPLLWFTLFALNLRDIVRVGAWWTAMSLAALQVLINLHGDRELRNNVALLRGGIPDEPTYAEFYDVPLFSGIRDYIGRPQSSYRVVSLGIYPAVAQFNGFYTLDSYSNNYPLAYKHEFRKIIAPELAKNASLRSSFDDWGNRCYIFSSELGFNFQCRGADHHVLKDFQIDTRQLRKMGGEYVISAARIDDSGKCGLSLVREFSAPGSYWDIYLYRVP